MSIRSILCFHLAQSQSWAEAAQIRLSINVYKYKVMCLETADTHLLWNRESDPAKQQLWNGRRRSSRRVPRCQQHCPMTKGTPLLPM